MLDPPCIFLSLPFSLLNSSATPSPAYSLAHCNLNLEVLVVINTMHNFRLFRDDPQHTRPPSPWTSRLFCSIHLSLLIRCLLVMQLVRNTLPSPRINRSLQPQSCSFRRPTHREYPSIHCCYHDYSLNTAVFHYLDLILCSPLSKYNRSYLVCSTFDPSATHWPTTYSIARCNLNLADFDTLYTVNDFWLFTAVPTTLPLTRLPSAISSLSFVLLYAYIIVRTLPTRQSDWPLPFEFYPIQSLAATSILQHSMSSTPWISSFHSLMCSRHLPPHMTTYSSTIHSFAKHILTHPLPLALSLSYHTFPPVILLINTSQSKQRSTISNLSSHSRLVHTNAEYQRLSRLDSDNYELKTDDNTQSEK